MAIVVSPLPHWFAPVAGVVAAAGRAAADMRVLLAGAGARQRREWSAARPAAAAAQSASAPRAAAAPGLAAPHATSARPLRVLRVMEPAHPRSTAGRMVISGRLADVCAELDRLAALEAAGAH